ncbi:hypothetical protein AB0D62_21250 [Streptomyces massasporeus]|uniref:hypothetical protein n=1 Tax=Streptomyces massasporeus TaxID=67324 RepID=UPI0033D6F27B
MGQLRDSETAGNGEQAQSTAAERPSGALTLSDVRTKPGPERAASRFSSVADSRFERTSTFLSSWAEEEQTGDTNSEVKVAEFKDGGD